MLLRYTLCYTAIDSSVTEGTRIGWAALRAHCSARPWPHNSRRRDAVARIAYEARAGISVWRDNWWAGGVVRDCGYAAQAAARALVKLVGRVFLGLSLRLRLGHFH